MRVAGLGAGKAAETARVVVLLEVAGVRMEVGVRQEAWVGGTEVRVAWVDMAAERGTVAEMAVAMEEVG